MRVKEAGGWPTVTPKGVSGAATSMRVMATGGIASVKP
jgi:hypothetical protein